MYAYRVKTVTFLQYNLRFLQYNLRLVVLRTLFLRHVCSILMTLNCQKKSTKNKQAFIAYEICSFRNAFAGM